MIVRWTFKDLARSRARVFASACAVGAAFALVIVFEAVWAGEADHAVAYIENAGADVWVMQRDVSNMHMASSFVRDSKRDQVAQVPGVARVSGILYVNTIVEAREGRWFSYVVGLEAAGQLGGPWSISAGAASVAPGETIVPETLADLAGVGVGDSIKVGGRDFEIVGFSRGTFSISNPVAFVHAADLAEMLTLTGYDSYALATAMPGVSSRELATRIRARVEDVEVLTTAQLVRNDRVLVAHMGIELLAIVAFIGTTLAVCIVAFVLYIHTSRRERELAIAKALGFRNRHIVVGVTIQAAVITGLAFVLAVALSASLTAVAPALAPQLSMRVTGEALVKVAVSGLAVAVLATLVSARRVGAADPMTVFQS